MGNTMPTSLKVVIGLATTWPFLYMFVFAGLWIYMVLSITSHPQVGNRMPPLMIALFILHIMTMFWTIALLGFYIYNVFINDRIDKDTKVLWVVVLFLGSIFAMPIYWYIYIWRGPSPGTTQQSLTSTGSSPNK